MLIIDFNFLLYMKFFNYTADSGKLGNLPTPKAADLHPIPPRLLLKTRAWAGRMRRCRLRLRQNPNFPMGSSIYQIKNSIHRQQ